MLEASQVGDPPIDRSDHNIHHVSSAITRWTFGSHSDHNIRGVRQTEARWELCT
jgi:hypothetical protein